MPSVKLTNINLQIGRGKLNTEAKFILKVNPSEKKDSLDITLKKPAEFINNQSLLWSESLLLQVNYEQKIEFQILTESQPSSHSNPEDINPVYQGYIAINKTDEDYYGWQVFDKNQKIGHLFASVEIENKSQIKQMANSSFFGTTIEVKKDSIAFTSIYAKFPLFGINDKIRVYLEFQMGGLSQRSAIKKIIQGEYHSYETLQIKYPNPAITKLTVVALTFEGITNKIVKIGHGSTSLLFSQEQAARDKLELKERVKLQKIFCYDKNEDQIGWISFKYIRTKDEKLDPRYFLQDKFATIGDINFKPLKNQSMTKSQVRAASMKPTMSGIEPNSRIFIPTAPRFQSPLKFKKCDQIGMGHQSLHIKDHPSYIKYRFSTLGYGQKIIPVERDHDVPGIGRYKLPSLFDRYK